MESTIPHVCSNNLQVEDRFPAPVQESLTGRGHELELVGDWGGPGSAQAIMVHPESGALIGGSDPRRDGYAVGY
jgi:gamma-glutamyltranspeptidase/glutathione hydrolase